MIHYTRSVLSLIDDNEKSYTYLKKIYINIKYNLHDSKNYTSEKILNGVLLYN